MPWYRTGTVAITAGQTTVTGTGTNFSANARVGDAFQGPDGRWYEVTNIASATVLSILPAYQGAAVNGGGYGLAPMQGYVKESADRLRAMVDQFGAKLAALGTTGNYDTLPVSKGGTGGTTQVDARAGLGLGSAATRNAGSYPGQVLVMGDRDSPMADSINTWGNSFQMWESTTTVGRPEQSSFGTIINANWGSVGTYGTQILMSVTGRMWFRAGDYSAAQLREVYHTANTTRASDGTLKAI